jgi:hypothetical protein
MTPVINIHALHSHDFTMTSFAGAIIARDAEKYTPHVMRPVSWITFYDFLTDVCITEPLKQGRGVHVTGVSAAYTFKLNKNILSE